MTKHPLFLPDDRGWLTPIIYFSTNWVSLTGVVFVTTATVLWLFLFPATVASEVDNPYLGILAFLILPTAFFGGLVLVPLGIYVRLRKRRRTGEFPAKLPPVDLHNPQLRRLLVFVGLTTCINVAVGGQLTYEAVSYVDGVTFCGKTCHTVMTPEFTAYQNSPHSRVECVGCHIGPGASWFVKSKLSGVKQLFATTLDTYPRPIPTPVENLRPARETCEQCHWPQKFGADRLRVIRKFADDEKNTESTTVLLMRIGGGGEPGIHGAHLGDGTRIRYAHADEQRQEIKWVEVTRNGAPAVTYSASEAKPEDIGDLPVREMDCMDCHNRPTHSFDLPERALDRALASGDVPVSLPWIKKIGLELLQQEYASREEARDALPKRLEEYYQAEHPEIYQQSSELIGLAAAGLLRIYDRNVFPEMNVTWGTYPNNIGHTDFTGCFRCHDDMHSSPDEKAIVQDCDKCHQILAMEEENPEILSTLGFAN